MNVFVDTSAILALADTEDHSYRVAAAVWQRLIAEKHQLLTTNYVLVETCSLLQARIGIQSVREFLSSIVPLINVIWIDEETHKASLQVLLLANQRRLNLVDCTSMAVARQSGIDHFFAFDRHLSERGFICLIS